MFLDKFYLLSVCDLAVEKLKFQLVLNFSLLEKSTQVWIGLNGAATATHAQKVFFFKCQVSFLIECRLHAWALVMKIFHSVFIYISQNFFSVNEPDVDSNELVHWGKLSFQCQGSTHKTGVTSRISDSNRDPKDFILWHLHLKAELCFSQRKSHWKDKLTMQRFYCEQGLQVWKVRRRVGWGETRLNYH